MMIVNREVYMHFCGNKSVNYSNAKSNIQREIKRKIVSISCNSTKRILSHTCNQGTKFINKMKKIPSIW